MKKLSVLSLVAILVVGLLLASSVLKAQVYATKKACNMWGLAGDLNDYRFGQDKSVYKKGGNSAFLKSTNTNKTDGSITLTQTCLVDDYLGKRVKMTAYIKSENVSGKAGVLLKVYTKDWDHDMSSGDVRVNRPVTGTMDWTKCEIVMDITEENCMFDFGVWLKGTGKIWVDNVSFEVVDKMETEITGEVINVKLPTSLSIHTKNKKPANLDFK